MYIYLARDGNVTPYLLLSSFLQILHILLCLGLRVLLRHNLLLCPALLLGGGRGCVRIGRGLRGCRGKPGHILRVPGAEHQANELRGDETHPGVGVEEMVQCAGCDPPHTHTHTLHTAR